MPLKSTKLILSIASVAFVLCLAVYGYIYFDFGRTKQAIEQSNQTLSEGVMKETQLRSLRQSVADLVGDKALLDSLFVQNDKVADSIQSLESLADLAGVEHSLHVDLVQDSTLSAVNKEILQFHFVTTGSWQHSIKFMLLLENMSFKTSITNVEMSKVTSETSSSSIWTTAFDFSEIKDK